MRGSPTTRSTMFVAAFIAAAVALLPACSSGSADPAPAVESTVTPITIPTADTSGDAASTTDPSASGSSDASVPEATESGPAPTMVGGAPAPTADPNGPVQVGPIDPGMTRSGGVVVTSIEMGPRTTSTPRDPFNP